MTPFSEIWSRAVARHGEEALRLRFPTVRTDDQLRALGDDRYLAAMAKRVFAAGFQWKVIQAKWDGFEDAFGSFDPAHVAGFEVEDVETLMGDTRIVRHNAKILATVANAQFVQAVSAEHGGFGQWLADWDPDDTVGLWAALAKGGKRLGGDTGAWFLRLVGRDTFRLSTDVNAALVEAGVVDKAPTGKRAQRAAQVAFNTWRDESGLTLGAVSTVLACSMGEVYTR
jgi:3-methyladenine DNA glycosylase Tag